MSSFCIGNVYVERREYDKALNDLNQAIQLNPEYDLAYISRGIAYQKLKNYDKALSDYNQAIRLAPNLGLAVSVLPTAR